MAFEYSSPIIVLLIYWWRTPERPGRLRRFANRYRVRWAWMALGTSFHLGIAVTMRLGIFPFGILALYPLLVHPDEWAALRDRRRIPAAWIRKQS
jgi:hypothetical protein